MLKPRVRRGFTGQKLSEGRPRGIAPHELASVVGGDNDAVVITDTDNPPKGPK